MDLRDDLPDLLEFALTCRTCLHQAGPDDQMQPLFACSANDAIKSELIEHLQLEPNWGQMLQCCAGTEVSTNCVYFAV